MILECKTPDEVYAAIERILNPTKDSQSSKSKPVEKIEDVCKDVKTCILSFRRIYADLPTFPDYKGVPVDDLHKSMDWCIEATKVVDTIPSRLSPTLIDKLISCLLEIKQVLATVPSIDTEVWKQSGQRAEMIVTRIQRKKPFFQSKSLFILKCT